jgi:4-amino-4-deoxy-L-arabinose transferase-like glycosyltransferase
VNSSTRDRWLLALLALLLIGAGIGLRDPWPADEPRFVLIAQQMLDSGNWLIPHRGIEIYSHKPPVFMWIQASMLTLFGSSKIGFLLPALFSSMLVLWLTHDLARRLWDDSTALRAGLLLLALPQFVVIGRSGQIDPVVCLWIAIGFYGLCRYALVDGRPGWLIGGSLAMGLGVITKGVGFLPLLMVPFIIYARRTDWQGVASPGKKAFHWPIPVSALALLAPILLWAGAIQWLVMSTGDPDLVAYRDDLFFHQTMDRYAGAQYHPHPWWYYLVKVIPVFWLPVVLLLPALIPRWKSALINRDARILLPLGWILLVVLFFSLSGGKRGVYLAPLLPAVSLVAAPFLAEIMANRSWCTASYRLSLGLALLALVVGAAAMMFPNAKIQVYTEALGRNPLILLLIIGAVATPLLIVVGKQRAALSFLAFFGVVWLVYGLLAYPLFNDERSGRKIMAVAEQHMAGAKTLGMVGWKEQMMLQAPMEVLDFGFSRSLEEQTEDAVAWMGEAPQQHRLLLPLGVTNPCLDSSRAVPLGYAHGRDWTMVDASALLESCQLP